MLVVTAALLLNELFSAKAALHQQVMNSSQTEMAEATSRFVRWAASNVKLSGTRLSAWPKMIPIKIASQNQEIESDKSDHMVALITWSVNGGSGLDAPVNEKLPQSIATNVSQELDEQRISATISVSITNRSGSSLIKLSRNVTARIFNADPYLVVTGMKSADSTAGTINSVEGDSGGFGEVFNTNQFNEKVPDVSSPALYVNTTIQAAIGCLNTAGASQGRQSSIASDLLVNVRSAGNLAYAFEAPCQPVFTMSSYPSNYSFPKNGVYLEDDSIDRAWSKNNQPSGAMPN